jgi:ABC-type Fe3+-hydroxamate transport system substrate-binding protein
LREGGGLFHEVTGSGASPEMVAKAGGTNMAEGIVATYAPVSKEKHPR